MTAGDSRVEATCQQTADAGPIALGEVFPSGASSPPQHANCGCWLEIANQ
jgi:hypothetical protein